MLAAAIEGGARFIDTAGASRNERLVAGAVASAAAGLAAHGDGGGLAMTLQTKVWYTHLGSGRTALAVRESLTEIAAGLGGAHAAATVLLHWPRCRRDIPWMNCEEARNNKRRRCRSSAALEAFFFSCAREAPPLCRGQPSKAVRSEQSGCHPGPRRASFAPPRGVVSLTF